MATLFHFFEVSFSFYALARRIEDTACLCLFLSVCLIIIFCCHTLLKIDAKYYPQKMKMVLRKVLVCIFSAQFENQYMGQRLEEVDAH